MAEAIRTKYNELIREAVEVTEGTEYGLVISGGWRCPGENHQVGGKPRSRHMWGEAVDLVPEHYRMA